jgi:carboxyl-terminal processing protease
MERKKFKTWLPLLLSISMVAGMYLGYKMRDGMPAKSFFYMERRKPMQEILDLIESKYVDDVNVNELGDTAIVAMLSKLDPHTQYIPARAVEQANDDIAGSFYGIGIEFNLFDDTLHVVNVLKDGPGDKAGLQTGDKFLRAGDSIIAGRKMNADDIRKILKGNRGTVLNVVILRGGKQMHVAISRDLVPVTSVDAAYMADSTIGYIRLNKFSQHTYREFMQSLEKLKKAGMRQLVLDLRGNGGGVLDESVEIADEFLEGDKLITYTEGKHFPRKEYRARRVGQFEKGALVVLADEGTASASEVLIGALQDWDRATVVGRRTFGKGLVQEQFDLSDNSALRLTISRYYTPLGRSIQRSYAAGGKAYYEEVARRFTSADTASLDSIIQQTSKKFTTKNGKTVYEGGGITPDYFITADTARFEKVSAKIYARGLVNTFGYKYVMDHPGLAKQYSTPAAFASSFSMDAQIWTYFAALAAKDSIALEGLKPAEITFLRKSLKLSIARQLWRNEGYFIVFNKEDEAVNKAMQLLKKP